MTLHTDLPPIVLTGADWPEELERSRERGPIARVELPGGVLAWSVTDTAVLRALMKDPRISKDAHQHWPALRDGEITPAWAMYGWVAVRSMLTVDGEDHTRLRRVVTPAFTPRRIEAMRPGIEAITAELIEGLSAMPIGETVDLRALFVNEVPIRVICELMGVPASPAAALCACTTKILDITLTPAQAEANLGEMYQVLAELIAFKADHRGEDVTSTLLEAYARDELSDKELADTLMLLIVAGYETTTHLLDQAIVALLRDRTLLSNAMAGEFTWGAVVEEVLRLQPPLPLMPFRFAVTDIDLGDGFVIKAGDVVLVNLAAVGRDPNLHRTPERFDPTRAEGGHLAFGHGPHFCVGAPLARLEATVALPALFAAFPDMELAADPQDLAPIASLVVNGHLRLPVTLGARTHAAPRPA
ncbi:MULTISPECIES: cytochrome P450 family protein [Nocardia]|uniref:cytochrome P450 family protein n=1 Tax=Nocardia TaxID=1817 RepID=UPI0002DEEAAC|nr:MULTISPECIES: cytochrome P450 [Nocardia]